MLHAWNASAKKACYAQALNASAKKTKKTCYAAGIECVGEEGMVTAYCQRAAIFAARCAAAADAFGREIRLVRIINARNDGEERVNRDDL